MTYTLAISGDYHHPFYKEINDIEKWDDVLDYLKNKIEQYTIKVHIYKYSSDIRLLGQLCVTMENLWYVASSPNDKVLL